MENLDLLRCLESVAIELVFKKKKKEEEAIMALKRDAIVFLENLDLLWQLESTAIGA